MKNNKIKEVIIVEGKHDLAKIQACIDADVLITNGTHVSKEFLEECKRINEERGIVIFTDPDSPGEMIRTKIIEAVGTAKHASLTTKQSRNKRKVGIEHASCEDIIEALQNVVTFEEGRTTLTNQEFFELGLSGQPNSQELRDILSEALGIPVTNAKRCFKYLNMMGIDKEEVERILKGEHNGSHFK